MVESFPTIFQYSLKWLHIFDHLHPGFFQELCFAVHCYMTWKMYENLKHKPYRDA